MGSFISVAKEDAIRLAQSVIDNIDRARQKRKNEILERYQPKQGYLSKVFGRKPPEPVTMAQLEKDQNYFGSDFFFASIYCGNQYDLAQKVLKAAKYLKDGESLQMSISDFSKLS
jgi:hypothetical protein